MSTARCGPKTTTKNKRKDEVLSFAAWMQLEGVMLSEIRKTNKELSHFFYRKTRQGNNVQWKQTLRLWPQNWGYRNWGWMGIRIWKSSVDRMVWGAVVKGYWNFVGQGCDNMVPQMYLNICHLYSCKPMLLQLKNVCIYTKKDAQGYNSQVK